MGTALAFALQALTALPQIIAAGQDAIAFINSTRAALATMKDENRDPTPAEWDALNAQIDALIARLNQDPPA
jgi:hypothetical protein